MLTRRRFLQLTGIAVSAAALPGLVSLPAEAAPSFEPVCGRALDALPVYSAPDGQILAHLWGDSITPILDERGGWYRLPSGYAKREALQPMIAPASRASAVDTPPFWGSVSGAVAVVRAYCAADAPIVTRVGHGGVLRVADSLVFGDLVWYGVAESESGALVGWTQAADWSPVSVDSALPNLTLSLDRQQQRLNVLSGSRVLLAAPASTGRELLPGVYSVTDRQVSRTQNGYHGAPWALRFGADWLTGVYWHNRFGGPASGAAIQVTPALAQWLYPRAAEVIIS